MRFLKRFIQLDNKLLRCFFIIQYSNTPLLQILNTPVEPIHGTTTLRGVGSTSRSPQAPLSSRTVGFLPQGGIGSSSFPQGTFPTDPRLKHSPAYTPWQIGYIPGSAPIYGDTNTRLRVRMVVLVSARHLPRVSLPFEGITLSGAVSCTASARVTRPS